MLQNIINANSNVKITYKVLSYYGRMTAHLVKEQEVSMVSRAINRWLYQMPYG